MDTGVPRAVRTPGVAPATLPGPEVSGAAVGAVVLQALRVAASSTRALRRLKFEDMPVIRNVRTPFIVRKSFSSLMQIQKRWDSEKTLVLPKSSHRVFLIENK
ncbi:hypothetical protein GCM10010841_30700 [Deinococcus aerophilus]|uniref:Uncharacterized protein n=1 Tax=Deinococcus aerophilus TaxID=522488 RepID=A0ABQ2GZY5_9DEIO|nr:hypothetical protein GCM10010841_30700 [Deinococcus aerophilus]